MKRILLLAAPLLLSACAVIGPPSLPPPPPVVWGSSSATIGFAGTAVLNGLTIRPIAVVEDSRCPINARCVWAGRLILTVEIGQRGDALQRLNMTLGQPLAVAGGTLTLVDASRPATQFTFELTR